MSVMASYCLVCSGPFAYFECTLKCDKCSRSVHKKCSKLTEDELKCLGSKNRILKFYCKSCVCGEVSQDCIISKYKGLSQHRNLEQPSYYVESIIRNVSDTDRKLFLDDIILDKVEPMYEESDLHKIKTSFTNPMDIFSEWYNEHCAANINVTSAKAFSLATISKAGKVSCRSLILRRLDKDGFVMMTDGRSRKSTDMADNPQASMLFLWLHKVPGEGNQTRQVRIEGVVNKLNTDNMQELYDIEPLFCKIRAQICEQGQEVDWERLKRDHDRLLGQVTEHNIQLPKPDHVVAYKLVPNVVEFYESIGQRIADRLLFVKDDSVWQSSRLAA